MLLIEKAAIKSADRSLNNSRPIVFTLNYILSDIPVAARLLVAFDLCRSPSFICSLCLVENKVSNQSTCNHSLFNRNDSFQ